VSYKPESEGAIVKRIVDGGLGVDTEAAKAYVNGLTVIADKLTKHYKDEINKRTKGSGALGQSVQVKLPITPFGFVLIADEYYDFIDEGVDAAPKRNDLNYIKPRQGGSRFKFKNLHVSKQMISNIRGIVAGSLSDVYGVAIGIKKYGLEGKNMTEEILQDKTLDYIAQDLNQISEGLFSVSFEKFADDVERTNKK
jgi:hypothetical protein